MLMASLPFHGRLFERTRTPLSRATLERRLGLLAPPDRALLAEIERVIQWDAMQGTPDDAAMAAASRAMIARLAATRADDLHDAVRHRLEMRTAVAALRARALGRPLLGPGDPPWGVGRWTGRIAANRDRRDLGLARVFPWIGRAAELLETDDPRGLERLLLDRAWADLDRRGRDHRFDFTAVAFYVLRWSMIDRWTRMNAEAAEARFAALVDEAVAGFGDPVAAEPGHG